MVALGSLWLPVIVSAVLVFIASNILYMVLPHHRSDFRSVPSEADVQAALRKFQLAPGDYLLPKPPSMSAMNDPAFKEKQRQGPIVIMTVRPAGIGMGPAMVQWFLFGLVVSLFAGYLASRALGPGASYLHVSQIASCAAFMGFGLASVPASIWYGKSWATTIKTLADALVYGFIVGGTFGWLWPAA